MAAQETNHDSWESGCVAHSRSCKLLRQPLHDETLHNHTMLASPLLRRGCVKARCFLSDAFRHEGGGERWRQKENEHTKHKIAQHKDANRTQAQPQTDTAARSQKRSKSGHKRKVTPFLSSKTQMWQSLPWIACQTCETSQSATPWLKKSKCLVRCSPKASPRGVTPRF